MCILDSQQIKNKDIQLEQKRSHTGNIHQFLECLTLPHASQKQVKSSTPFYSKRGRAAFMVSQLPPATRGLPPQESTLKTISLCTGATLKTPASRKERGLEAATTNQMAFSSFPSKSWLRKAHHVRNTRRGWQELCAQNGKHCPLVLAAHPAGDGAERSSFIRVRWVPHWARTLCSWCNQLEGRIIPVPTLIQYTLGSEDKHPGEERPTVLLGNSSKAGVTQTQTNVETKGRITASSKKNKKKRQPLTKGPFRTPTRTQEKFPLFS